MKKPTLNAGCGADIWGDIRIDIERFSKFYLKPTAINVLADLQYLPFKNDCFSVAKCNHVLEHVENPQLALKELRRVSNETIVRVPVWHFYSLLIEAIALFTFIITNPRNLGHQLHEILRWKERYSKHKWYIRFSKPKTNKLFGLPKEYEVIFDKRK